MKKKTNQEFIQQLKQISSHIIPLEDYKGTDTKIKCLCTKHNFTWEISPYKLLTGRECPKCGREKQIEKQKKTTQQFIEEFALINPNVEIIGNYNSYHTPISCKCKKDGYIWQAQPADLMRGKGCPVCANESRRLKRRKNPADFLTEIQQINKDINIIGTYINNYEKIECECKICGFHWEVSPHNLLAGKSCPNCNKSKGEKEIAKILDMYHIQYFSQHSFDECKNINKLKFDFYLPLYNLCIEYDGEQHFRPVSFGCSNLEKVKQNYENTKNNDKIKNQFCKQNQIDLLRIKYTEFNNIDTILKQRLNLSTQNI